MNGVEIAEARLPEDVEEVVDLVVARTPAQDRVILRSDLDPGTAVSLRVLVARDPAGGLAGAALARTSVDQPPGSLLVLVTTRQDMSGRGLGSRLFAEARAGAGPDVTRLVTCVRDGDAVAEAVARHWGFEHRQTSVTAACALSGATAVSGPAMPPGVSVVTCDDLRFDDEDAVAGMLRASQTNPEADLGLEVTLPGLRAMPSAGQRPLAVVTRIGGRPVAISFAVADGDQMHLVYTGVDPAHRGRALARTTKQALHVHARELGVRTALTDNDQGNTGMRRVNEQLGYVPHSAWHWMMRQLG